MCCDAGWPPAPAPYNAPAFAASAVNVMAAQSASIDKYPKQEQDQVGDVWAVCRMKLPPHAPFVFWREKLWKMEQTEKLNVEVPAVEAADTRLLFSECGSSFWIKFSFCTVGVEGAWPDEAQTRFRVME